MKQNEKLTDTPEDVVKQAKAHLDDPALTNIVRYETRKIIASLCDEVERLQGQYDSAVSDFAAEINRVNQSLSEVTKERDRIVRLYNEAWLWVQQQVKHPNSGLPPAAMTLMEMLTLLEQEIEQLRDELEKIKGAGVP